jgi:ComF family protein
VLYERDSILCLTCTSEFPFTGYHHEPQNEVAKLFWGRVEVSNAASFFYFRKGSRYQNLIHEIKYHNQQQLAVKLGRWYAYELNDTAYCLADVIIPVPLHFSKQKKRGFNQSELIAKGLSEGMGIPLDNRLLKRIVNTDSQTKKTKYERWVNVEKIFQVTCDESLNNKHILLVDDVVTTGSTLEACASALLSVKGTRVSILTLAFARLQ